MAALSLVKLLISLTSGTFPQITIISLSGNTYEGFLILDDLPKTKDVNGVCCIAVVKVAEATGKTSLS